MIRNKLVIFVFAVSIIVSQHGSSSSAADEVPETPGEETITLPDYLGADIYLSKGELELLNRGYNFYLSHQPEKAVKEFETFLKDFPDSPARDAAFFWLGKSFYMMKDFEMAGRLFTEIKQMFPESRLISHVSKELEVLAERNVTKETRAVSGDAEKQAVTDNKGEPSASLSKGEKGMSKDHEEAGEYRTTTVSIGGKKYSSSQISGFMNNASSATNKLGIKVVVWRNGDLYEDFIGEQILYEEAEKSAIRIDTGMHKELTAKYGLTTKELGYLRRYLTIVNLIELRCAGIPATRKIESLSVSYSEGHKKARKLLAEELQALARRGLSFEEICRVYPGDVKFSVMEFPELQEGIRNAIGSLQDGEIGVAWTKDGYTLLKPVTKRLSLGFVDAMQKHKLDEIRSFIKKYLEELRNRATDVVITRAE